MDKGFVFLAVFVLLAFFIAQYFSFAKVAPIENVEQVNQLITLVLASFK